MRCADMLMAFPTLLLALIIVTALGGSLINEILAIGIALTPNFVRLARSLALTIREQDYIMAARALGSGQLRVMARHVFPNALYALVVVGTLYIATAIRTEASLSFLGPRDPAAHAELGQHPQRGPPVHQVLPVDHHVLRARDHAGGARLQPGGRRAPRPARSPAPRRVGGPSMLQRSTGSTESGPIASIPVPAPFTAITSISTSSSGRPRPMMRQPIDAGRLPAKYAGP